MPPFFSIRAHFANRAPTASFAQQTPTFGHGTLAKEKFAELVTAAGLTEIVDVMSFPGSRRNPQFGTDAMAQWLPESDVAYSWMRELRGRRKEVPDSKHVALRHPWFQAYADHMETPAFLDGVRVIYDVGATPPMLPN